MAKIQTDHFVEWRTNQSNSLDAKVAEIMQHWQSRYELGKAVLLTDSPITTLKYVQRQWQKLTRQLQKERETKESAEDILSITRTISRMQRVKFTIAAPDVEEDANFYILKPDTTLIPAHCYTLYSPGKVNQDLLTNLISGSLSVLYQTRQPIAGLQPKKVLEERVKEAESALINWLAHIEVDLNDIVELEKTNEALDTILSSNNLQAEFLHKTKLYVDTLQLAQPITLSAAEASRLKTLKSLEHQVRILSPSYLSDHILDSQSDDSFLLRDIAAGKLTNLEAIKSFIAAQRGYGRLNLAAALELKAGFTRI